MQTRTDDPNAGASQSPKHATRIRAPERPARSRSDRSRATRREQLPTAPTGPVGGPGEKDGASRPRVEGQRILAEALAALPGALAAGLIVLYLVWWGAEMGARVPRGHALLLGILGCVVASIAAVVLGLRVGCRGGSSRPPRGAGPARFDHTSAQGTASRRSTEDGGSEGLGAGNPGPPDGPNRLSRTGDVRARTIRRDASVGARPNA